MKFTIKLLLILVPILACGVIVVQADEICPSVLERFENRTFPSVALWPHRGTFEDVARYDFIWSHGAWYLDNVPLRKAEHQRLRELNPDILFFFAILIQTASKDDFPEHSPVWLRDTDGERVFHYEDRWGGWREYQLDIVNPLAQDIIVAWILEKVDCQLYDGLAIDGLAHNGLGFVGRHLHPGTDEELIEGITRILHKLRANVPEDFLIIGNARSKNNLYSDYINGDAMEPGAGAGDQGGYTHEQLQLLDSILLWNEKNLRFPQVNWSEVFLIEDQPPDSPDNNKWIRVFTVRSMTLTDGYVSVHHEPSHIADEKEIWYRFWDAPLGRPIGETKGQLYDDREGVFIREFTNGWAVYNRSGKPQEITLSENVIGWQSGQRGPLHVIPDLDGEIYLKQATDVNGDGVVNILDMVIIANAFGEKAPDVNGDGIVNILDLVQVANAF